MRHTITALVAKPAEAQRIIDELTSRCLCDRSDISLMAQDNSGTVSQTIATAARAAGKVAGAMGAAGAAAGSAASDLASAVTRDVPGLGVLSIAGRLGGSLAGTALATVEDLARAFVHYGIEQSLARQYAEALRQGGILIVVDAKTEAMARCARQVMATTAVKEKA